MPEFSFLFYFLSFALPKISRQVLSIPLVVLQTFGVLLRGLAHRPPSIGANTFRSVHLKDVLPHVHVRGRRQIAVVVLAHHVVVLADGESAGLTTGVVHHLFGAVLAGAGVGLALDHQLVNLERGRQVRVAGGGAVAAG